MVLSQRVYLIGIACLVCILFITVIFWKFIRYKISVKVNCWFCNENYYVQYGSKNAWTCPYCEQYNGFNEDGDFNKIIPSQYDELLNRSYKSSYVKDDPYESGKGLCEVCNRNQLLKIKQLAAFVPRNEAYFDEEVYEYKQYLESVYKLCQECQIVLHEKLTHQDSAIYPQLFSWKMEQKRKQMKSSNKVSPVGMLKQIPICARIFQLCSLAFATMVCVQNLAMLQKKNHPQFISLEKVIPKEMIILLNTTKESNPELPLCGVVTLIGAIFAAGKYRLKKVDAFTCFLWLFMLFSQLPPISSFFPSTDDKLLFQGFTSIVVVCCTVVCVFCDRSSSSSQRAWKDSRLTTSSSSISDESCYSPSVISDCHSSWTSNKRYETSASKRILTRGSDNNEPFTKRPALLQDCQISTTSKFSSNTSNFKSQNLDFPLNNSLQAMKISTPKKSQSVSGMFTPRLYCPEPSASFQQNHSSHRSVISPARFKFKNAHSSWVAGGYWASPSYKYKPFQNEFTQATNAYSCPASRAGSVSGDDRLSVFSEPVRAGSTWLMPSPRNSSFMDRMNPVHDATSDRCTNSSTSSIDSICSSRSVRSTPESPADRNHQKEDTVKGAWKLPSLFQMGVLISIFCNTVLAVFIISKM